VPDNYSLFKNNSAARSARLNQQEESIDDDRPAFRRSNMSGSAARAMRLADEERKRILAERQAPGEGERPEQKLASGTSRQVNVGLRVGGGKTFERAKTPEAQAAAPTTQPVAAAVDPAAPAKGKSGLGSAFSKLFSVFGGDK
jgi:hypothetical protein